jgi:ribosomal protein S18 acetylase RimI-like enzyme
LKYSQSLNNIDWWLANPVPGNQLSPWQLTRHGRKGYQMITYTSSAESATPARLVGFFVGWPNPPTPRTHQKILQSSDEIVLAMDDENDRIVGFITAISDGIISAYIPLLEVLPEYQGKGIGGELVKQLTARLADLYMIDLSCDENVQAFYTPFGFTSSHGMAKRNYQRQNCQ